MRINTTQQRITDKFSNATRFTSLDIAASIPCSHTCAKYNLNKMKKARQIYVIAWTRKGMHGKYSPVYQFGNWHDAPKPEKADKANKKKRISKANKKAMLCNRFSLIDQWNDMRKSQHAN